MSDPALISALLQLKSGSQENQRVILASRATKMEAKYLQQVK